MKFLFKSSAEKQFAKLDPPIKSRLVKKLEFFISSPNPLFFAEHLTNRETGQYRFRIGDFRVIFDVEVENDTIIILTLGHRREIYR